MYSNDEMNNLVQDKNLSCLNFTTENAKLILNIKLSLGVITVIANVLAIALILISRKFKETTFRLVIYLLITDILQAVAMCLALSPITVRDEKHVAEVRPNSTVWNDFCGATGFVLMTTMWMGNIVIIWIVVYLLVLGWRLYRSQKNDNAPINKHKKNNIRCEMYGVLFLIITPFIIGIIPVFLPNEMYGISGLWCWIRMIHITCGDINTETLSVVFVFFYGPLVLIVLFSNVSMVSTIVLVCYGAVRRHGRTFVNEHQQRMKEIMLVLVYPMLYCTVCLILLANRVYSIVHIKNTPFFSLWIAHTIADPVRVMLPAIAFLLHPYVWRAVCTRKKSPNADQTNSFKHTNVNENESVEADKLITTPYSSGPSRRVNYGSCNDELRDQRKLSLVVESK